MKGALLDRPQVASVEWEQTVFTRDSSAAKGAGRKRRQSGGGGGKGEGKRQRVKAAGEGKPRARGRASKKNGKTTEL